MTKIKNFFKSITNSKKKVFALALSVCVVVLSIASSSIAYFTDTDTYLNTFTSGKVDIALTINGEDIATFEDTGVYPGQEIPKVAVIALQTGSQDAYLGAIITVTAHSDLALTEESVKTLFSELPSANVKKTTEDSIDTFKIYIACTGTYSLADGEIPSATIFTKLVIPSGWTNAQMTLLETETNFKIQVDAYAVQSEGLDDAKTALKTAFPTEFADLS